MSRSDALLLGDVLESIERIDQYTAGLTEADFGDRRETQDAVVRRLEIIGEAVKGISSELKQQHPDVRWREIAGARDVLIHQYFRVDLALAWQMIREDLPRLRAQIERIQKGLEP